jgi:hypothetical protein
MGDTHAWYAVEPAREYGTVPSPADAGPDERMITFASAITTPHDANNTVYLRYFPASPKPRPDGTPAPRRAVVVMAQWNADEGGHVGLCKLLVKLGISAVRITLPYHDRRMPPELQRADFIVSSNVGQTLQVCRQAVLDTLRAVAWLDQQGYQRIGLLGTSLGSCLSMLTGAHEPLVKAMALNHVSPWFADVVWEGLSTAHVRASFEGHVDLPLLRELWRPISPQCHMERIGNRCWCTRCSTCRSRCIFPGMWSASTAAIGSRPRSGSSPAVTTPPARPPSNTWTATTSPASSAGRSDGLEVPENALEGVVEDAGQGLHERGDLTGLDGIGDGDGVGDEQPDSCSRQDGRDDRDRAEQAETQAGKAHGQQQRDGHSLHPRPIVWLLIRTRQTPGCTLLDVNCRARVGPKC